MERLLYLARSLNRVKCAAIRKADRPTFMHSDISLPLCCLHHCTVLWQPSNPPIYQPGAMDAERELDLREELVGWERRSHTRSGASPQPLSSQPFITSQALCLPSTPPEELQPLTPQTIEENVEYNNRSLTASTHISELPSSRPISEVMDVESLKLYSGGSESYDRVMVCN